MGIDMREKTVLIQEMLELSKVKKGERIIVVTTHDFNQEEMTSYRVALQNLGAEFVHVVFPPQANGAQLKDPGTTLFYDVIEQADMIVTPSSSCVGRMPTIHSQRIISVLQKGTRMLQVQYSLEKIRQLWPTEDMIARTIAGAKVMEKAETIRIVSGSGSAELVMDKKGRPAHTQYGMADVPGRWDNFGCGCISSTPLESSANGTLVVEPPAAISPLVRFVSQPFTLTIKDGSITKIEGGLEAELLKRWLDQFDDPESYGTSHVGWGTHKKVGIGEGGGRPNLISYLHNAYGTLLIAFGDSLHAKTAEFSGSDGKRKASSHIDIGGWNVDFYLDDRLICSKGEIVDSRCK